MTDNELKFWLALWRISGLGPVSFARIRAHYPDLSVCFTEASSGRGMALALPDAWVHGLRRPDWHGVEKDLAWQSLSDRHKIVTIIEDTYPAYLREIGAPPPLLFVAGDLSILSKRQLAIVGSRRPTLVGKETARQFAEGMVNEGWAVTSGLALGIDAAVHHGSLAAGGKTIAVLGTGIDVIYPRQHVHLFGRCIDQGAVVTELYCGAQPLAKHFPRRNRIISGLARGVLVVEAAKRSGSLITASYALEQGRDVFAIPGSIYSEQAHGCLALIQQGAKCVISPADVVAEYGAMDVNRGGLRDSKPYQGNMAFAQEILQALSCEPLDVDWLVSWLAKPADVVIATLESLVLEGYVLREMEGYVLAPSVAK